MSQVVFTDNCESANISECGFHPSEAIKGFRDCRDSKIASRLQQSQHLPVAKSKIKDCQQAAAITIQAITILASGKIYRTHPISICNTTMAEGAGRPGIFYLTEIVDTAHSRE